MGYEIHITRRANLFSDDEPGISSDEWKAYISSDPDMRLDGYAEAVIGNGAVLRVEDEGLAVWTGYSRHGVSGNMAWLYPGSGGIIAKNPDEEIIRKMFEIAQALGARVVGDDEEEYGADGKAISPDDLAQFEETSEPRSAKRRPWWKIF